MKVVAIVVGWNSKKDLEDSLGSLVRQTYSDLEIVYVDNASRDGSVEFVKQNFPNVHVIDLKKNRYFGGGNNTGIKYAISHLSADYLALLNPDAIAEPNWIENAVKAFSEFPGAGAVGPKVLFWQKFVEVKVISDTPIVLNSIQFDGLDYQKLIDVFPGWTDKWELDATGKWHPHPDVAIKLPISKQTRNLILTFAEPTRFDFSLDIEIAGQKYLCEIPEGISELKLNAKNAYERSKDVLNTVGTQVDNAGAHFDIGYGAFDDGQYGNSYETRAGLNGVAAVFSRECFSKSGLFDLDYTMYSEESELMERIAKAQFQIVYDPFSVVRHKHMQSTGQAGQKRYNFWSSRNQLLLAWDHFGFKKSLKRFWYIAKQNSLFTALGIAVSFWAVVLKRVVRGRRVESIAEKV